jgi:archaellum component FlaC
MGELIDKSTMNEEFDIEGLENFREKFNNTLKTLKGQIAINSQIIGDEKISLNEIRVMVKTLKDAFDEGLKRSL